MLLHDVRNIELIDVDDVIRSWNHFLNYIWNRENPNNKKPIPKTWDIVAHYGSEIIEFYQVKHAEELYTNAPVMEGALEFLYELKNIRDIYLLSTQPNKEIEEYTEYWLIKNSIPFTDYKFTHDKSEVKGNHLLDDWPRNLEKVLQAKSSIPVCFDQPWNQDWKGQRVKTHQEFLNIVRNHQ
jgi:5'(3')-deoxyribonucleotidase